MYVCMKIQLAELNNLQYICILEIYYQLRSQNIEMDLIIKHVYVYVYVSRSTGTSLKYRGDGAHCKSYLK